MKSKKNLLMLSFINSFILCSTATIIIKYYNQFSSEVAGTHNVVLLFGEPLKYFLSLILLLVSGLITLMICVIRIKKPTFDKPVFPAFIIAMGSLLVILPYTSAYSISRFVGTLIPQTITSIAIVANTVFMMVAVCCGVISSVDLIIQAVTINNRKIRSNCLSMILTGSVIGFAFSMLLSLIIISIYGIPTVFIIIGIIAIIIGIINTFSKMYSSWNSDFLDSVKTN